MPRPIQVLSNPEPVPDIAPPVEQRITTTITTESVEKANSKWNTATSIALRKLILNYFNETEGKYNLTIAQIERYAEMGMDDLPERLKKPIRRSVIGWEWDNVIDTLDAALIAFGIGGTPLSEAGQIGITPFYSLSGAVRQKVIKLFSKWDTLKERADEILAGADLAGVAAVSGALRHRRRNYRVWGPKWNDLKQDQRHYLMFSLETRQRAGWQIQILAEKQWNVLPNSAKQALFDNIPTDQIDTRVRTGEKALLRHMGLYVAISTGQRHTWPQDKYDTFINSIEPIWNGMTQANRRIVVDTIYPQATSSAQVFASRHRLLHAFRGMSGSLSEQLGRFAVHVLWVTLREHHAQILDVLTAVYPRPSDRNRAEMLAEIMDIHNRIMPRITSSFSDLDNVGAADAEYLAKILFRIGDWDGLQVAGEEWIAGARMYQEIAERARFHAGDVLKLEGQVFPVRVRGLYRGATTEPEYDVDVLAYPPFTGQSSESVNVLEQLSQIEEGALEEWTPWTLNNVLLGGVWDANMNNDSRRILLEYLLSFTIAGESTLPVNTPTLIARPAINLGDHTFKKVVLTMIMSNLVEDIEWMHYSEDGGIAMWEEGWAEYDSDVKYAHILYAMDTQLPVVLPYSVEGQTMIHPTNLGRMIEAEGRFSFLPLDYAFGIAVSLSVTGSIPSREDEIEMWAEVVHNYLEIVGSPDFSEDQRFYYLVGAGVDPDTAITYLRPRVVPFFELPENVVLKALYVLKSERERGVDYEGAVENTIARGRTASPEIPRISVHVELNHLWGQLDYEARYRAIVGAYARQRGYEAMRRQYEENNWNPPASFVQAASVSVLNEMQNSLLLDILKRRFEEENRNITPIQEEGSTNIERLADELEQIRREGQERATTQVSQSWNELEGHKRVYLSKHLMRETGIAGVPWIGDWGTLTQEIKDMLIAHPDSWDTYVRYGASKKLEEYWAGAPVAVGRGHLILGCGYAFSGNELQEAMTVDWGTMLYGDIQSRYTSQIIGGMVDGFEREGTMYYGDGAIGQMVRAGREMDLATQVEGTDAVTERPEGTPIDTSAIEVGDFVKGQAGSRGFKGVIGYISGRNGSDDFLSESPQLRVERYWAIYLSERRSNEEARNLADRYTLSAYGGGRRPTAQRFTAFASDSIAQVVRFERNVPLPILRDTWGEVETSDTLIRKRTGWVMRLMKLLTETNQLEMLRELFSHIYPHTSRTTTPEYMVATSARQIPAKFRSHMIQALVTDDLITPSRLFDMIRAELRRTTVSPAPTARRDRFLGWIRFMGGTELLSRIQRPRSLPQWQRPQVYYAILMANATQDPPDFDERPAVEEEPPVPPVEEPQPGSLISRDKLAMGDVVSWGGNYKLVLATEEWPERRSDVVYGPRSLSNLDEVLHVASGLRSAHDFEPNVTSIGLSRLEELTLVRRDVAIPYFSTLWSPGGSSPSLSYSERCFAFATIMLNLKADAGGNDKASRLVTYFNPIISQLEEESASPVEFNVYASNEAVPRIFHQYMLRTILSDLFPAWKIPPSNWEFIVSAIHRLDPAQWTHFMATLENWPFLTDRLGLQIPQEITVNTFSAFSFSLAIPIAYALRMAFQVPGREVGPPAEVPVEEPAEELVNYTQLKIGDVVKATGRSGPPSYGMVYYIGRFGAPNPSGSNTSVWAIWEDSAIEAIRAAEQATESDLFPHATESGGGRGRLTYYESTGNIYVVLQRAPRGPYIDKLRTWDDINTNDLVKVISSHNAYYGVVVHKGTFSGDLMRDSMPRLWAFWQRDMQEAIYEWGESSSEQRRPSDQGGALAGWTEEELNERIVYFIERHVLSELEWEEITEEEREAGLAPLREEEEEEVELFADPFRQALGVFPSQYSNADNWPRAQLVLPNNEMLNILPHHLSACHILHVATRDGDTYGVPVLFLIFPLNPEGARCLTQRLRGARQEIKRQLARIKSATRSRGGQAVISLQVGEFYKNGEWHGEKKPNPKKKKRKKKANINGNYFPNFIGNWSWAENPVDLNFIRYQTDVYPTSVIKDFIEEHAGGWVTSFARNYSLDRLPRNKRVYVGLLQKPGDIKDRVVIVMGLTQNIYDNISDVFSVVHKGFRRMGIRMQMQDFIEEESRNWINPDTEQGARRIYTLVKAENIPSNAAMDKLGYELIDQFLNDKGEKINKYVKELYDPPRENPYEDGGV